MGGCRALDPPSYGRTGQPRPRCETVSWRQTPPARRRQGRRELPTAAPSSALSFQNPGPPDQPSPLTPQRKAHFPTSLLLPHKLGGGHHFFYPLSLPVQPTILMQNGSELSTRAFCRPSPSCRRTPSPRKPEPPGGQRPPQTPIPRPERSGPLPPHACLPPANCLGEPLGRLPLWVQRSEHLGGRARDGSEVPPVTP